MPTGPLRRTIVVRRYGTGTVWFRERDRKWCGQAELPRVEGRRQRLTVTADTEAAAWKALGTARSSSAKRRPRAAGETVEQFLERWLRDVVRTTKRERTYVGYASIVRNALVPAMGQLDARKLSARDVQRWVGGLSVASLTIRHYIDVGRGAYRWGIKHGLRDDNPFRELDLPPVTRKQVKAMTPERAQQILAAFESEWFAPLVTVALYTGLRQGELLGLRWEDVNLGEPMGASRLRGALPGLQSEDMGQARALGGPSLTVSKSLSRLPTGYKLTEPKSASSRRVVPLTPQAAAALRAVKRGQLEVEDGSDRPMHSGRGRSPERLLPHMQQGGASGVHSGGTRPQVPNDPVRESRSGLGPNEWGLIFSQGGRPIDGTRLTHQFQAALARAGLPVCTWHALRHGYASLMLSEGIPLSVVSELLGHSGIAITKDTYGAIADSAKYAATARLAELVG